MMLPTSRPSSPPPDWRRSTEPRRVWWVDVAMIGFIVTIVALIVSALPGCNPTTAQRVACSAVGVTLTAASERIVNAMATDYVASEDDAAVDDRWQSVLAAYETAAVAQNAWADALEAGESYDAAIVGVVYCDARAALATVVAMPDWPLGGCP